MLHFLTWKRQLLSEAQALKLGDNAIGFWGDDSPNEVIPMCALLREVWEDKWGTKGAACGKKVSVTYAGKSVIGELRDTMPHLANRMNRPGFEGGSNI